MKKNLLLLGSIIVATHCFSQLYVKVKPSYNKSLGGQVLTRIGSIEYTAGLNEITESSTNVRSSLGQGYMGNFSLGYSFTSQFSTELGVSYLKGKDSQGSYTINYTNSEELSTYTLTGHLFSIDPTLVFSSREKDFFRTYVSLGFPINFISYDTYYVGTDQPTGKTYEILEKFTGSVGVGVSTKFGMITKLNESLELFGEIGFTYINFSPNKSEITSYKIGGDDSLSIFNTSDLESVYKENIVVDYNYVDGQWIESYNTSRPRVRQKFDTPFSYLSFSFGVKIYLFTRREEMGESLNLK
jgi:hypothetical protein